MIEAFRARKEYKTQIFAQGLDRQGIAGQEVPVRGIDAALGCISAHAIRSIDSPVESDRDDRIGVLAKGLAGDFNGAAKVLRDRRTHVMTARENHADDERLAARDGQVEGLALDVSQDPGFHDVAYCALADIERALPIVFLRAGSRGSKNTDTKRN